jgi:hypothetical protein
MINLILNKKIPGRISVLNLDATIRETEEYTNEVTEFPVESGFSISDHVIRKPERVTIEGFITNTPIPNSIVSAPLLIFGQGNRVKYALEKLLTFAGFDPSGVNSKHERGTAAAPQLIDVETGLRVYNDMIIESLSVPRDNGTGETLRFTVSLKKCIIVKTEFVKIQNTSELNGKAPNATKQAAETKNKGVETPKKIDNLSTLAKVENWIGRLWGIGNVVQ